MFEGSDRIKGEWLTHYTISPIFFMEQNWAAIIPSRYLMAKDINSSQKLLIGLISSLSNLKGYCFASNDYLANLLDISKTTVSHLISDLEHKGYIGRAIYRNDKQQIEQRILVLILDKQVVLNSDIPISENGYPLYPKTDIPISENQKDNNKINNYINNNINNIYDRSKNSKFKKPELFEVQNYFEEQNQLDQYDSFFNYYESNGWKVGKNPMKDWKAAARNWIKNSKNYKKNDTPKSNLDLYAERRAELHEIAAIIDRERGISS